MPMLGQKDFNALSSTVFNNNYDEDSAAVLRADFKVAQQSGDTRAQASILHDLKRTGTSMPATTASSEPLTGSTGNGTAPEARAGLNYFTQLAPDMEAAIFSGDQARQEAATRATEALKASAAAQAESGKVATEADIATQDLHNQLLRAVGLDVKDPNSFLSTELKHQAEVRKTREQLGNHLSELEGISFWQNPFAFLAAQPELKAGTAQYNNMAAQENSSSEEITRLQSVAESVMKLTPAKNADLLRQKAVLDANATVSAAQAKAEEYNAQNAAGHAKALLDAFTARHNVFQSMLQVQGLEEGIQDRRQRQEDLNFWRGVKRDDALDKEQQKKDEKNRETALAIGINTYRRAINGTASPDLTPEDVKRMPAELRSVWYETILRGNYGNSYQESVPFIERFGNITGAAQTGNASMMQIVRNVETRAQKLAPEIMNREKQKNPLATVKPQDAMAVAYGEVYATDAGIGQKGADKSNVNGASPYAIDYDAAAALAKSQTTPSVVGKALIAAKDRIGYKPLNNSFTASILLNDIEARVIAGESTPKDAAEQLSRFYALQSASSYEQNGLRYFNLPQPTDWVISPGGVGKQQLDLMNPTKIENYLTARIASEKRSRMTNLGSSFGIAR
jgi:hypothetical protein